MGDIEKDLRNTTELYPVEQPANDESDLESTASELTASEEPEGVEETATANDIERAEARSKGRPRRKARNPRSLVDSASEKQRASHPVKVRGRSVPAALPVDRRTIGAILQDSGKISAEDVETVLRQQEGDGKHFGEAAMSLGLVTAEDVRQALARQYGYPVIADSDFLLSRELTAAYNPFCAQVESLRELRSQLMLRWITSERGRGVIALVSTERGDGRTFMAANLAVVFAQLGANTLLIDADLRTPRQHELFGLTNRIGLSSVLAGRADASAIQTITTLTNLCVLPAGPMPPNPQELLGNPVFGSLLLELQRRFDVILLDTTAGALNMDAQLVAAAAGAALVVARQDATRIASVRRFTESLTKTRCVVLGSVLNAV
jgi:chain length determinant protein tyrosine kinase EpsG